MRGVMPEASSDYRVAPALAVRLIGLSLAAVGVLVVAATLVVALAGLDTVLLLVVAVVGALGAALLGGWLRTQARVVSLDELGYRVRFVRGSGVAAGRWADVSKVERYEIAGADCMVLFLRDGRTTTIPLEAVAGEDRAFAQDVRARLERSRGGAARP